MHRERGFAPLTRDGPQRPGEPAAAGRVAVEVTGLAFGGFALTVVVEQLTECETRHTAARAARRAHAPPRCVKRPRLPSTYLSADLIWEREADGSLRLVHSAYVCAADGACVGGSVRDRVRGTRLKTRCQRRWPPRPSRRSIRPGTCARAMGSGACYLRARSTCSRCARQPAAG